MGGALSVLGALREKWAVIARAEVLFLGPEVHDSAVVADDMMFFALVGAARRF